MITHTASRKQYTVLLDRTREGVSFLRTLRLRQRPGLPDAVRTLNAHQQHPARCHRRADAVDTPHGDQQVGQHHPQQHL